MIDTSFEELSQFVKKEIMNYSKDSELNKYMILRLRGLATGRFFANKNHKPLANYSFKIILDTFKSCKTDILKGFNYNQSKFNNEEHKFNYALVIVGKSIEDSVIKLENAKLAKETNQNLIDLW